VKKRQKKDESRHRAKKLQKFFGTKNSKDVGSMHAPKGEKQNLFKKMLKSHSSPPQSHSSMPRK